MTSFLNSIPKKKKTSEELILSIKKSMSLIAFNTWEEENDKLMTEQSLTKNISEVKIILCGDSEHHEHDDEKIREISKYIQSEDLLLLIIDKIDLLTFDVRKDSTSIFTNLMRRNLNNFVGYILEKSDTIKRLTEGYLHNDSAFSCGLMLRECIRHESLAKHLLSSEQGLVWHFFDTYVHLPNFDVASDAFNTLKELLTTPKSKQIAVEFLDANYDRFLEKYETLLQSENYVTRRRSLKLLAELLTDRSNYNIMMRYIASKHNLKTIMNLLKNKSANIQFEAFHVFKIFVANPNKSRDIAAILSQNRVKLVAYLEAFHLDKEDPQFVDEKRLLIETLKQLVDVPASRTLSRDMSFSSPERHDNKALPTSSSSSSSSSNHSSPLVRDDHGSRSLVVNNIDERQQQQEDAHLQTNRHDVQHLNNHSSHSHHAQKLSEGTTITTRDTLPSQDSSSDGIAFPDLDDLKDGLNVVEK